MRDIVLRCKERPWAGRYPRIVVVFAISLACLASSQVQLLAGDSFDPFEVAAAVPHDAFEAETEAERATRDPFDEITPASPAVTPLDVEAYFPRRPKVLPRQVHFQIPASDQPQLSAPLRKAEAAKDPCAAAAEKPLHELGIGIALPSGQLPTDLAATCWDYVNATAGPLGARSWPEQIYQWDATCLCHRPLYFEEINLERYGYGCGCCLQPIASAAHFFATVPALPYCMAADCPHECVYTLGHYRPGSCPPWRCHRPPLEPLAAASEAGVLTGMIFLIP